jgi:hypothetical protein
MEPMTEHHEVPEKKPDTDEDQEQRFRGTASYVMSVAGTVAAFVAGFDILPSSTSAEKALNLITVIGLSGAIIFGIGAWRSGRRFMLMTISTGLSFTCLAALSVVAQTASSAQVIASPASPGGSQPTSDTGSPGPTGSTAVPTDQGSASAAPGGYLLIYRKKQFTMPGDSCQTNSESFEPYFAYTLFAEQEPMVTAPYYGLDLPPSGSWDMILNCMSSPTDIEFSDQASLVSGNPDASACYAAVNSSPIGGRAIEFSRLSSGEHVCMIDSAGELILVTLLSVSDSTYDTSWSATAWSLPPNS